MEEFSYPACRIFRGENFYQGDMEFCFEERKFIEIFVVTRSRTVILTNTLILNSEADIGYSIFAQERQIVLSRAGNWIPAMATRETRQR